MCTPCGQKDVSQQITVARGTQCACTVVGCRGGGAYRGGKTAVGPADSVGVVGVHVGVDGLHVLLADVGHELAHGLDQSLELVRRLDVLHRQIACTRALSAKLMGRKGE